MGKQLEEIFVIIEEQLGNNGRLALAKRIKMSKTKAKEVRDEPETVAAVRKIAAEILGKDINSL